MLSKQTKLSKEHDISKHITFLILPYCYVVCCAFVVQTEAKSIGLLLLGPDTQKPVCVCIQLKNFDSTITELGT